MKPSLCPDMPLLVNDWLSSTKIAVMSPAEEGAYIRLLCHAWNDSECLLPDDDETLAALSRLGDAWHTSGPKIRRCFEPDPARPGRIFNPKQRALRLEQTKRIQAAIEQRRGAANSRWRKEQSMRPHCDRTATALREDMRGDASVPLPLYPSLNTLPTHPEGGRAGGELAAPKASEYPATLDEVLAGLPDYLLSERGHATEFLEKMQAQGWRDKRGQPVTNWRKMAEAYIDRALTRSIEKFQQERKPHPPAQETMEERLARMTREAM